MTIEKLGGKIKDLSVCRKLIFNFLSADKVNVLEVMVFCSTLGVADYEVRNMHVSFIIYSGHFKQVQLIGFQHMGQVFCYISQDRILLLVTFKVRTAPVRLI